jgi:hypothetical protein
MSCRLQGPARSQRRYCTLQDRTKEHVVASRRRHRITSTLWRTFAVIAVMALAVGTAQVAQADVVKNAVANDVGVGGVRTIAAGGSTTVDYYIEETNAGGFPDCDAADGTPVTVAIHLPAGVTADKSSLTFDQCGDPFTNTQAVTFSSTGSPAAPNSSGYSITHTSADSAGFYNDSPADWNLKVESTDP